MKDNENPEDGRCDWCDSRCGNAHLQPVNGDHYCEDCRDAWEALRRGGEKAGGA